MNILKGIILYGIQFLLTTFAIISIFVRFAESKDPWNYEYDMPESQVLELAE